MPELPEVEVTRLSFAHAIAGARIVAVHMGKPLRWPLGIAPKRLNGRTVQQVRRRGKYLLFDLDVGVLALHLGMSGRLWWQSAQAQESTIANEDPHVHCVLQTTKGQLSLRDPRRFAAVVYAQSEQDAPLHRLLARLGPEPLEDSFTPQRLAQGLAGRQAAIKQVLLAGQAVAGVGNIYASESLFLAGIRPDRSAASLNGAQIRRLHAAIVDTLKKAVELGGSTLRDFAVSGQRGYFQLEAQVYGREGLPCKRCARPVQRSVQGQRSTFWCKACQK